jgi:hypothetical protein
VSYVAEKVAGLLAMEPEAFAAVATETIPVDCSG